MYSRVSKSLCRVLVLATVALLPAALAAQDSAKPAAKATGEDSASRWDIFAGYSYLAPKGTVQVLQPDGVTTTSVSYKAANYGAIASGAYFFNKYVGAQVEGAAHDMWIDSPASNDGFVTLSGGLILRFPTSDITPFVHALVGTADVGGPQEEPYTWGVSLTTGGGLDYATPLLHHHLGIRLFQADYEYIHADFGTGVGQGRANISSPRLSTGLVYHLGTIAAPAPVTLSVAVDHASIFPGDPVTASATAGSLDPKLNAVYTWTGSGVTGTGASANVATASLAPGTYTVKAQVKEGKPGREGLKPWEVAEASTTFTVKAFEPPTVGCSVNSSNLKPGETATVLASGVSPQNRPLTYSYTASAGTVSGSGSTATFDSTGAPTGTVDIACNVLDDKGQTASAKASVNILPLPPVEAPAPPAEQVRLEARLSLHSVFFPTNLPRTEKPNGGLVVSQQQTLAALASDFKKYLEFKPNAHLTLFGHADQRGSVEFNQALSERRVARAKKFLVDNGVSESSIETRSLGKEQNLTDAQVKAMVEQNSDLSDAERKKVLRDLAVIVLAQNRRVDITLSTNGEQSVRQFPFNAADALTLLDKKSPTPHKKAAAPVKK